MCPEQETLYRQFQSILPRIFQENRLSPLLNQDMIETFARLGAILITANEKMNLTAITEPCAVATRHFADSLLPLTSPNICHYLPIGARLLDVGCGGGFPCLPLAIARPDLKIIALDSTAKKLDYVASTAKELGLSNLSTLCGRAEELAQPAASLPLRESFDAVCARAVARLPILSELCVPYVKVGGYFIAMKGGDQAKEELREVSSRATRVLGVEWKETLECSLQGEEISQDRKIFFLRKTTKTPPIYPRLFTQIKKKPL